MKLKKSPLAPEKFPILPSIRGVNIGTSVSNSKYKSRQDILTITFDKPASVAGVFTLSQMPAAPVEFCKKNIVNGYANALIVNAGIANSFTGKKGTENNRRIASYFSKLINSRQKDIYICSTGVIGEQLPVPKIKKALKKSLFGKNKDFKNAAKAIMTTDTFPKGSAKTITIDNEKISIVGIAKGSGMIAPNMATMLSFIFTDALIEPKLLQTLLNLGVRDSFNSISVDSDTSTNDTVLVFATGQGMLGKKTKPISKIGDKRLIKFRKALDDVMKDLAIQIVKDGEGATKLVQVNVRNAISISSAKKVAMSIANSPLIKTAIAGSDPNWGRIIMAIGKTKEQFSHEKLLIKIGNNIVIKDGELAKRYSERKTQKYMKNDNILIDVDLGIGTGLSSFWTCDLTEEYVRINTDYRS
jgi:glutamate N-acetyltransferase/amino-acid N-acetyltransferase